MNMKRMRKRLIIGLMVAGMFSCLSLHAQTKISAAQAKTMIAKINAAAAKIPGYLLAICLKSNGFF